MKNILKKKWFIGAMGLAVFGCAGFGLRPSSAMADGADGKKNKSAESQKTASPATPDRAQSYYHYVLGHALEEEGRFNEAIDHYKQALQLDPQSGFLHAELASAYVRNGRIREAVLEAEEAIKKDKNNIEARRLLGNIYRSLIGEGDGDRPGSESVLQKAIEQYQELVRIDAEDLDNYLVLGQLYRRANQNEKSIEIFKKVLEREPESEAGITNLAFAFADKGEHQQAIALLEKVIHKKPNSVGLVTALAYAYDKAKDSKKAIEYYRKAIELDQSNLNLNRNLAQALLQDGQIDAALQEYKKIVDVDKEDAGSFLRLGQIYLRQKKFDEALQMLLSAQIVAPDNLDVQYNLALLYEEQGKYPEAIQKLQDLLKATENKNNAYSPPELTNRAIFMERMGFVYRQMEKYDEAIKVYEQLKTTGKDNVWRAESFIIDTHRTAKNYAIGLKLAKDAAEKYPQERTFKFQIAELTSDLGRYDEAAAQMKSLLKGSEADREVYLTLAQISERARRFAEAEKSIRASEPYTKDDQREMYHYYLGAMLERQKKYDAAEEQFKKVLELNASHAGAMNYLGYMWADRNIRLDESLRLIERAVELDPLNGAYLDSLGWVHYRLNRLDLAERYLLKALERIDKDPTIHDHLGDVYYKTGRFKLAVAQWERSLDEYRKTATNPFVDEEEVARVQKKLEELKVKLAQNVPKN